MYLYNIGYNSYEESEYFQLFHEKKFSQKEFEKIVTEAVIFVLKKYKSEKTSFQCMLFDVVDVLVKKFGFKEAKFTGNFDVFGWADISDPNDWKYERDEQLKRLTAKIANLLTA